MAAIQVARRIGAIPLATTRTEAKRQGLLDAGAAEVIVSGGDAETVAKEVRRLTGGRGAEVIFDAIGGPGFRPLAEALAEGGTVLVHGWLDRRPAEVPWSWPFTLLLVRMPRRSRWGGIASRGGDAERRSVWSPGARSARMTTEVRAQGGERVCLRSLVVVTVCDEGTGVRVSYVRSRHGIRNEWATCGRG
ncbi:zinc-binding dehydrogenase [Streptomyces sp. NPDC047461]|uniref:zinc-binding dehydrogenase n=1 Tax=Streptomyces sp. NPDC047461 TaxID=3155619 RepID=UPI0033DE358F